MRDSMKRWFRLFRARFATPLPQGMTEIKEFCEDILNLYKLPDNKTTNRAIGFMIQNLGPTIDRMPKRFFGTVARKSIATEIAIHYVSDIIKEIKRSAEQAKIDEIAHAAMNKCPETEAHEKMS